MKGLSGLLRFGKGTGRQKRARVKLDTADTAVYAIGDVHGCLDALVDLERAIVADGERLRARKVIIMLGDYIDRGPASAQVIDWLIAPPPAGFERICLAGNHEVAMLDYLDGRISLAAWMPMGVVPTLLSYGIDPQRLSEVYGGARDVDVDDMIRSAVPPEHVAFLRELPILVEAPRFIFVHAGIRPELGLDKQSDDDLTSIRTAFYERARLLKKYVVHGHTPVDEVRREGPRVNIDTGAYFSGRLTALRIWKNKGVYLTN
jgi:serine/threonine protein phosphatase 1